MLKFSLKKEIFFKNIYRIAFFLPLKLRVKNQNESWDGGSNICLLNLLNLKLVKRYIVNIKCSEHEINNYTNAKIKATKWFGINM